MLSIILFWFVGWVRNKTIIGLKLKKQRNKKHAIQVRNKTIIGLKC